MLRVVAAAPFAFVITLLLFVAMQSLVAEAQAFEPTAPHPVIDLSRVPKDEPPEDKVRPPKPERLPPVTVPPIDSLGPSNEDSRVDFAPTGDPSGPLKPGDVSLRPRPLRPIGPTQDGDARPVVRVNPVYPPRAAERGMQGVVRVRFCVDASGVVEKARVIHSDPPGVFDAAALKAVRRWRYKPKVVDGAPVGQCLKPVELDFTL
ncbi:MAG: TonB family protein [Myxococcota bacterium]